MLSIIIMIVNKSVVLLSVLLHKCFAECHYAECHHAECRGAPQSESGSQLMLVQRQGEQLGSKTDGLVPRSQGDQTGHFFANWVTFGGSL